MKPNTFFLVLLFLIGLRSSSSSQCQWAVQRGPDPRITSAIAFVDSLHGWVGRNPAVRDGMLRTTNGGKTWDTVNFAFDVGGIASISFIDTLRGWCNATDLTKIYKTTDGGVTWVELYAAPDYRLFPSIIQFVDSLHGFGVGADTTFNVTRTWRTTDGGVTWSSQRIVNAYALIGMKFVDTTHGWIVGQQVYRTTDGGASWSKQTFDSATIKGLSGVDFVSEQDGWCAGGDGWIIHTTDGGQIWTNQAFIQPQNQFSAKAISFADSLNGWVFGFTFFQGDNRELIYRTTNGGNSWFQESIDLSAALVNGIAIDACHAWAISHLDGRILSFDTMTDVAPDLDFNLPATIRLSQNYPNPFNPNTTIEYQLRRREHVTVKIFNEEGREVSVLLDEVKEGGRYTIQFNASDLSSGVYYFDFVTSSSRQIRKSILIK